jgi:hypothetical protein
MFHRSNTANRLIEKDESQQRKSMIGYAGFSDVEKFLRSLSVIIDNRPAYRKAGQTRNSLPLCGEFL